MDLTELLAAVVPPDQLRRRPAAGGAVDVCRLIERAQAGDADAVAALYQGFAGAIYRYMTLRAPTITDAEDLTAEVFMRMVEGLPDYRITEVPFEAWLYRIASARVADFYRHAGRRPETDLSDTLPDQELQPEEQMVRQQMLDAVRMALRQLSDEHRTILILRFVERRSHEEVAAILNKSMTAVKSAQHRALNQLAALLGSNHKLRHYLRGRND